MTSGDTNIKSVAKEETGLLALFFPRQGLLFYGFWVKIGYIFLILHSIGISGFWWKVYFEPGFIQECNVLAQKYQALSLPSYSPTLLLFDLFFIPFFAWRCFVLSPSWRERYYFGVCLYLQIPFEFLGLDSFFELSFWTSAIQSDIRLVIVFTAVLSMHSAWRLHPGPPPRKKRATTRAKSLKKLVTNILLIGSVIVLTIVLSVVAIGTTIYFDFSITNFEYGIIGLFVLLIACLVLYARFFGRPPTIHDAIALGKKVEVQEFIDAGIDVNCPDKKGQTPLHIAVKENELKAIPLLLEHGANPNIQDKKGQTPLHIAANNPYEESMEIAQLLLAHGADRSIRDATGRTALDITEWEDMDSLLSSQQSFTEHPEMF